MNQIDDVVASMDLRTAIRDYRKGLLLKPLLQTINVNELLSGITVEFNDHPLDKVAGDNWFHPSTHPLWPDAALYHYLAHPERLTARTWDYSGRMSVTVGKIVHRLYQACMEKMDLLPADLQVCEACPPEAGCQEPGVMDTESGERGHMDGVLALPRRVRGSTILEMKTAGQFGGSKMLWMEDLDLDAFRQAWPDYYAQAQSYLRMSGRRLLILIMIQLGHPWELREIQIPYDRQFCNEVREKYLRVRQAVADQRTPRCACVPSERKKCPSRGLCSGGAK